MQAFSKHTERHSSSDSRGNCLQGRAQASVGGASRCVIELRHFPLVRARATSRPRAALEPIGFWLNYSAAAVFSEAPARGGPGAFESQWRLLGSGGCVVAEVLQVSWGRDSEIFWKSVTRGGSTNPEKEIWDRIFLCSARSRPSRESGLAISLLDGEGRRIVN